MSSATKERKGHSLARGAFEAAFCPALVAGSLGAAWYARRAGVQWMEALFLSTVGPLLIITAFEWILPHRPDWNYPFRTEPRKALRELGKDLLYVLLITRLHSWLLPKILPSIVPAVRALGKHAGVHGVLNGLHPSLRVALLLVVGEFFWYWGHRLQHANPWFWRFHATHHVPVRLTALKSARNHPVDLLFLSLVGYLPLVALGAKSADLLWAALIQNLVNITSHSNVPVRGGIFGWFFSTPDYHRIHHSVVTAESNSNYGCRLLIWDRVFGTFRAAARTGPRELVVGVAPAGERTLRQELLEPFYRA